MRFLEENILSIFGFPNKIIIGNALAFKYAKVVNFFLNYNIELGHSTAYYPKGNGLAKSSNKSLLRIIKNMFT